MHSSSTPGAAQAPTEPPDSRAFIVDGGQPVSLAELLSANADDPQVCEWAAGAMPGDNFPALVDVQCVARDGPGISSSHDAEPAPHQPNEPITVGPTYYWWCLHGERAGHYVVCPNDPTAPMSLAVCDDFGALVPVRSYGAHEGFAGWPA